MNSKIMGKLRPYVGFSRFSGPNECACLIFAHTAREAKRVGFQAMGDEIADGEFTDFGVRLMRDADHLVNEMTCDFPHVIDSPKTCSVCELWGSELNEDGVCETCEEYWEANGA